MQTLRLIVVVICFVLAARSVQASEQGSAPRLAGIVSFPGQRCAVITFSAVSSSPAKWFILSEGQKDGELEVARISPEKGSVDVRCLGIGDTTIKLHTATNLPFPGVVLEDASLNVVLSLFDQFTNRSLLRWPVLPATELNLRSTAQDELSAARVLAQALFETGLIIIPDGDKFLMVIPGSEAAAVKPHAPSAKRPARGGTEARTTSPSPAGERTEPIPPGMIDFRAADVRQVAAVYREMVGRKVDLGDPLNSARTITFRTTTPLTKEEAVYAMETLLCWSGVQLSPVRDDKLNR